MRARSVAQPGLRLVRPRAAAVECAIEATGGGPHISYV
jgi:hypothetical protein